MASQVMLKPILETYFHKINAEQSKRSLSKVHNLHSFHVKKEYFKGMI